MIIINNMINEANISMLFAGDPAQFASGVRNLFDEYITNPREDLGDGCLQNCSRNYYTRMLAR